MLAFAQKFPEWKDFPSGLHVMVVDQDKQVLDDIKLKLEACDYAVTGFSNGHDALAALRDRKSSFHVAVVEAATSDELDGFQIVDAARHLTTIMMSQTDNMAIMMQGIAAGASEFLQKPLSEEKLKNIWQHVVRKALFTGELVLPDSLLPSGTMTPQLSSSANQNPLESVKTEPSSHEIGEGESAFQEDEFHIEAKPDFEHDSVLRSGRFPGPSTPQLEQASRMPAEADETDGSPFSHDFACAKSEEDDDDRDNIDGVGAFFLIKMEAEDVGDESDQLKGLLDARSKEDLLCRHDSMLSADLQFEDIELSNDVVGGDDLLGIDVDTSMFDDELPPDEALELNLDSLEDGDLQEANEEALLLAEVAKAEVCMISGSDSGDLKAMSANSSGNEGAEVEEKKAKRNDFEHGGGSKGSKNGHGKKKMKVDWTPELHRRFVQAVEQLGVDKAIPSRILELMGVQCLTRHNVASHLQKYRSHKKHLQAREAEAVASTWVSATGTRGRSAGGGREDTPLANGWAVSRPSAPTPPHIQPRPAPVAAPGSAALHVWGHPTIDHSSMHFWAKPAAVPSPAWQAHDGTFWHQPPTWGHSAPAPGTPFYTQPVVRLPLAPMTGVANMAVPVANRVNVDAKFRLFHPPKETVDAAINEVLRNPFMPLPLGLKPPSLESVVAELHRQGASQQFPPCIPSASLPQHVLS